MYTIRKDISTIILHSVLTTQFLKGQNKSKTLHYIILTLKKLSSKIVLVKKHPVKKKLGKKIGKGNLLFFTYPNYEYIQKKM